MRVISSNANPTIIMQQIDKKIAASKEQGTPSVRSPERAFKDPDVTISGEALLKQRLFGINDPRRDAPMLGKAEMGKSMNYLAFLNRDDRRLLGNVYEWSSGGGADLGYVDDLALALASYREHNDGKVMIRLNQGKSYDAEGHKTDYNFTGKDAATARRIVDSEALKTTRLDQGFIRFITDKDYGGIHHNDFDFMEQVINRFSAKASEPQQPLGVQFAKYEFKKDNFILTLSKDKRTSTDTDKEGTAGTAKKIVKPKEITLESLRADIREVFMRGLNIKDFSRLFDVLFNDRR